VGKVGAGCWRLEFVDGDGFEEVSDRQDAHERPALSHAQVPRPVLVHHVGGFGYGATLFDPNDWTAHDVFDGDKVGAAV
jgi:hypothetical protein